MYSGILFLRSSTMPAHARRHTAVLSSPPTDGSAPARKSTRVTLPVGLVAEPRARGVNVSPAAEVDIAAAVARSRQELWLAENQDALDSSNAFVELHGLPLAQHRRL